MSRLSHRQPKECIMAGQHYYANGILDGRLAGVKPDNLVKSPEDKHWSDDNIWELVPIGGNRYQIMVNPKKINKILINPSFLVDVDKQFIGDRKYIHIRTPGIAEKSEDGRFIMVQKPDIVVNDDPHNIRNNPHEAIDEHTTYDSEPESIDKVVAPGAKESDTSVSTNEINLEPPAPSDEHTTYDYDTIDKVVAPGAEGIDPLAPSQEPDTVVHEESGAEEVQPVEQDNDYLAEDPTEPPENEFDPETDEEQKDDDERPVSAAVRDLAGRAKKGIKRGVRGAKRVYSKIKAANSSSTTTPPPSGPTFTPPVTPAPSGATPETLDDYKEYVERLVKKSHLEQMTPDVRARFDTYAKNKDFIGDMKNWAKDESANIELSDDAQETAYKAFLAVFERMSENLSDLNKNARAVFDKVFGNDKVFNHPQPRGEVEAELRRFARIVLTDENETYLTRALEENPYILRGFDDNRFDYKKFRDGIKSGKYNTDPKFRTQVLDVIKYIRPYMSQIFQGTSAENYRFSNSLPANVDDWFVADYNPGFQVVLPGLVKKLTTDAKFREEFKKYDYTGTISGKVEKGLEKTAYDNPESDNFIPPVYTDRKNIWKRADDAVKNFATDKLDSWGRVLTLRGTRRFFTPYSRTILESFAGVKNKDGKVLGPTDGIKGIIDNKDAILAKITEKSPTAKKQFEWFVKKMETYSKKMPNAFNGALHNSQQLRQIVAQLIVDAIHSGKDSDIEAAKASMEILSTMKYGLFTSRTLDGLRKEEFSALSQLEISKKYEAVGFVAKAMDKATKYALLGIGRGITAIARNGAFNLRTKFRGNMKFVNKAHDQWVEQHSTKEIDEQIERYDAAIAKQEDIINQSRGERINKEAEFDAAKNNLAQFESNHSGKENVKKAIIATNKEYRQALVEYSKFAESCDYPEVYQYGSPEFESYLSRDDTDLFEKYRDIKNKRDAAFNKLNELRKPYEDVEKAKKQLDMAESEFENAKKGKESMEAQKSELENARDAINDDKGDQYLDLMAFWDMLETHYISHRFTLSAKAMRNGFLDNYAKDGSQAHQISQEFLSAYHERYSKVA